eukprot:m.356537 g.356537  ORF g.356537 m.356537 type:complete len:307 (-) comp17568_c0_seq1:208-1128(-)
MGQSGSKGVDWSPHIKAITREDEYEEDKVIPQTVGKISKAKGKGALTGTFGNVSAATLKTKEHELRCLSKALKAKAIGNPEDVLRRVVQMAQVQDDHVVKLLLVQASSSSIQVALQSADETLFGMLQRGDTTEKQKYTMLAQLSDGLAALDDAGFCHGAICTRNCYVAEGGYVFRLGDWLHGASWPTSSDNSDDTFWAFFYDYDTVAAYQTEQTEPLPTVANDIWAFGTLCLEVFGNGTLPLSEDDGWVAPYIDKIVGGDQLSLDSITTANSDVAELIGKCWADREERPDSFWLRAECQEMAEKHQ